jgi:phosphatidylglycerophosphate synthase
MSKKPPLLLQLIPDKRTRLITAATFTVVVFLTWCCISYRNAGHRWASFLFAGAIYVTLWQFYKRFVKRFMRTVEQALDIENGT